MPSRLLDNLWWLRTFVGFLNLGGIFLNLRKPFSANGSQQMSSTMIVKNWNCRIYNQLDFKKKSWLVKLYMTVQKLANCSIRNVSMTHLSLVFSTYLSSYSNAAAIASMSLFHLDLRPWRTDWQRIVKYKQESDQY